MAFPFSITTNNLSGTNSVETTLGGTKYVKTLQQDVSTGQWVQVVLQLSQGVLVPVLQTLFPVGIKPNLYDSIQLGNGQTLGQFNPYGTTGTGTGTGTDNTFIVVLLAVAVLIFGRSFLKQKD